MYHRAAVGTISFLFRKIPKIVFFPRAVVAPLIGQVMQGYNCTVFAYGQTGTGKTYTMEGGDGRDDPSMTWESDPTSGIVPRQVNPWFGNQCCGSGTGIRSKFFLGPDP